MSQSKLIILGFLFLLGLFGCDLPSPPPDLLYKFDGMPVGKGHAFHRHPELEEIIYVESGAAAQWVGQECRKLVDGESAHIPADVVHGTWNSGAETLVFLAILAPANCEGPMLVDMSHEEPWVSIRG